MVARPLIGQPQGVVNKVVPNVVQSGERIVPTPAEVGQVWLEAVRYHRPHGRQEEAGILTDGLQSFVVLRDAQRLAAPLQLLQQGSGCLSGCWGG